jgi:hypothetical protein
MYHLSLISELPCYRKTERRREARKKEKGRREEEEDEDIPMMISSQPNSDIQSPL